MNFTNTILWARLRTPLSHLTLVLLVVLCTSSLLFAQNQQATLVKDINVGAASSNPTNFTTVGNKVIFTATDAVNGTELWATDGTSAGSILLKDFVVGSGSPTFSNFVELNGSVYFVVDFNEATQRTELWKTVGSISTTTKVFSFSDAMPNTNFTANPIFTANNKIYTPISRIVAAQNVENALWESTGLVGGTRNLGSISTSFQNSIVPTYYYEKGQPIFATTASVSCSNPLASGSIVVIDSVGIRATVPFGSPTSPGACYTKALGVMGRNFYFLQATMVTPTPSSKVSLVKVNTDGVKTVLIDSFSTYSRMTSNAVDIKSVVTSNFLYFFYELQMWKTDGTTTGTLPITNRLFDTEPNNLILPMVDGDVAYFVDNFTHFRYWKVSNGTKPVLYSEETNPFFGVTLLRKVGNNILSFGADRTVNPPLLEIQSSANGQSTYTKIGESRQIISYNNNKPDIAATNNALYFGFVDPTFGTELGTFSLLPPVIAPCDTDKIAPVFQNCPPNISLTTTSTSAIATWATPTATDNCTPTPSVSSNYTSESPFGIGTTAVTYTVTDAKNNTATCRFNITVTASTATANCASKSNAPWSEWIATVQLNTLNNVSEKTRADRYAVGYSDWKDKSTTLARSQSYPLSITPGLSWSAYQTNLFFRAWIDYNANGIYEDTELVLEKNSVSATVNQLVTIPTTAVIGTTTMRISMKKDAYPTACETFVAGEVEDYSVVIQAGTTGGCTPSVPTKLYAKDITATTAKLVWSKVNNAVEYEYQVLYDDASQSNGGALISSGIVADTFANLTLVSGRLRALVRSRCVAGGTLSAWSLATHFNQQSEPCTQAARTAFLEDFENTPVATTSTTFGLPLCWTKLTYHAPSVIEAWTDVRSTSRGTVGDNTKRAILYRSTPLTDSALIMLVSPEISNLAAGTNRLRFKAANTFGSEASGNAVIQIGTLSNPFDASSFTPFGSQTAINGQVFSEYIVDFATYRGTDRYIVFKYISSGGDFYRSLEIDDVAWETRPSNPCLNDVTPPILANCPANISVTTTGTTAVATWTTPIATDNCTTTPPSVSSTFSSGQSFPIGTTTVVYTARDAANNSATCAFSIVVSASTVTANCTSKSNAPWNEWISNVQFNTLNNTSSKTRDDRFVVGYSDWKDKSTTVSRSQTHPLSITPDLSWPGYITPLYFRAWIDYNRNGIYEDTELVLEKNSNSTVVNQSVTIPVTAAIGTTTMRISMKKGAYATACESFDLGDVEDYTVVIQDGGDPCAADVTPPVVINCPQNIVLTNTTNQCKMVSFTPPSATDNCTPPAYSAILKNGSQFLNFTPTTNADLIIGRWDIGSSYEKTIDAAGNILSSVLLPASYGVTTVFQNGVYTTLTSSGKWELSADGTKFIGDKGAVDERYYKIIALSTTEWKEIGPYRLDGTPYFGNKLYEYWASKKPNMFVNICPNIPIDSVLFTFNDTKENISNCRFNITVTQPVNTCRYNDSLVLVDVYNSMGGANWVNKWDLTKPMNTWVGIGTDTNGCVIAFVSGQLTGNLAPSIGNLSQLRYMRLGGSRAITGTIPNNFANLSNLIELQIEDNQLTGNIPSFVGNLRNLNQILLYKNMLTGPIPTNFGNLNKMQWLILNNNQLSGTIPSNLSNMTLLNALELSNNSFTGSIPNVFGNIPSLTYLGLKNNNFNDTLPKNLARLTNIYKLDLSNNLLSGCIPNELKPLCGKDIILSGNVNLPNGGDWTGFCTTNAGACPVTNDLEVSVVANSPTFKKWTTTGFKINLKNLGNQAFTNIELTFPYPAGTVNGGTPTPSVGTFQQYCTGGVICYKWTIPSLAAGTTATLDVPLFVLDVATILGTAQLLASTPIDVNAANNTATATMTLQTIVPSLTSKPTQLIPVVIQTLSPNPTDGELSLKLESLDTREVTFEFYNALGKAVKSEKRVVGKGLNRLDFSLFDLEQGVYFIVPSTGQGRKVPTKFVKL